MATVYAPIIDEIIPAFSKDEIIIPFKHNPAVSNNVRKNMDCFILDFTTGNVLATFNLKSSEPIQSPAIFTNIISGSKDKIEIDNYYKIQLAYSTDSAKSYISVGKCISPPTVGLNGFIGAYSPASSKERLYSYNFKLYNNSNGKLLEDTGEQVYYYEDDEGNTVNIEYIPYKELQANTTYNLAFTITTMNKYTTTITAPVSKSMESPSEQLDGIKLQVIGNPDNGSAVITFLNTNINIQSPIECELIRENINQSGTWESLAIFTLNGNSDLSRFAYEDKTIEHNVKYRYAIRQIAAGSVSQKIESNEVSVGFEDIFLSDENRMLKIKFNPQVSSFKETLQETKIDTIGSKYPFFFKNGQVGYKELPISGLISYLMDDAHDFIPTSELGLNTKVYSNGSTQLSDDNIAIERKFKLEVMDWLNNGQPKLFRSPAEGNYLVRLMNVSLSPNTTVGRMLHTFSATGYEIGDSKDILDLFKQEVVVPNIREVRELSSFQSGETTIDGENISNIEWYTNTPGFLSKIVLDDDIFYNISGEFISEKDKCYNSVKVYFNTDDNVYNSFKYECDSDIPAAAGSKRMGGWTFASAMAELDHHFYSYTEQQATELMAYYVDVLIVRKDIASTETNSYIIINGEKIELQDEQPRTLYNLGYNLNIYKPKGVHLDISGYYKEV